MGIEPVEDCVNYVNDRIVALEVESGNVEVQLTGSYYLSFSFITH